MDAGNPCRLHCEDEGKMRALETGDQDKQAQVSNFEEMHSDRGQDDRH
jgi:hypothetical protein